MSQQIGKFSETYWGRCKSIKMQRLVIWQALGKPSLLVIPQYLYRYIAHLYTRSKSVIRGSYTRRCWSAVRRQLGPSLNPVISFGLSLIVGRWSNVRNASRPTLAGLRYELSHRMQCAMKTSCSPSQPDYNGLHGPSHAIFYVQAVIHRFRRNFLIVPISVQHRIISRSSV